jgi:uncharacterized protein (TIGR04255 family)
MTHSYEAPPILNAIIEVKFSGTLPDRKVSQIADKLAKKYANKVAMRARELEVNVAAGIANFVDAGGLMRLSSSDATEIVTVMGSSIIWEQLAPYPGWEIFFGRFIRDWKASEKFLSSLKIIRVGTRFINRIDLLPGEVRAYPNDYLTVSLKLPPAFENLVLATFSAQSDYGTRPFRVILNSAFVDSPMPHLTSMLFDIDVVEERQPPDGFDELSTLLTDMRQVKDEVFESSITPYARQRFRAQ